MLIPGGQPAFALVLGNGLVTSSGKPGNGTVVIIQPIFHRSRMAAMADRMVQVGEHRLAEWPASRAAVDIAVEMMQTGPKSSLKRCSPPAWFSNIDRSTVVARQL